MRRLAGPAVVLPLLAAILAAFLAAPFLAAGAHLRGAQWRAIAAPDLVRATAVSVASASTATLLVALGGIPLGFCLARGRPRWTLPLGLLVQLPLALPPLSSGILLLFLLGYDSPLGRLSGGALTDSFAGIVLAEAFVSAPFLVVAARSAFLSIDPELEAVAATLGHGGWGVFRRVGLPLAWRGIAAGLLLGWLRAFGEFGATVMVAYHPYSLPVFTYVSFGSAGLPSMLPVLAPTVLIAILAILAGQRLERHRRPPPRPDETPAQATPPALPPRPPPGLPPVQPLALRFVRRMPGFTLDVEWRTGSRRLAILGASGSGKTATLRLIAGLDPAETAELLLGGIPLHATPPHRRGTALVPQGYGLLPHLALWRQVTFPPGCDPGRARHWIARLGLDGLEGRRPAELSQGQQQRVALCRALVRPAPRLLLLDEPFSALDATLRDRARRDLLALQSGLDLLTILVTHDPEDAMALADEVLLLDHGRVLQSGRIAEVFRRPVSERAARLLGADAVARAEAIDAGTIRLGEHPLSVAGPPLSPGPVGIAVRAGAVRLADSGVPAWLVGGETRGDGVRRVLLRIGPETLVGVAEAEVPAPGPCHVRIDPAAIQIWPLDRGGADAGSGARAVA